MKMDEANALVDHANAHEGPNHPGFVRCELRSLQPPVLAYLFDSPKHAGLYLRYRLAQGESLRLEQDPANESVVLLYR